MKPVKKNTTSFFKGLKLYSDVYKAGPMVSLLNAQHLKLVLKNAGWRIATLTLLSSRETNRFVQLHNFGIYLLRLHRNHGELYVIKFLKASQLALQKKIAGSPVSSLRDLEPDFNLPRLTSSGVPSIIKLRDRQSIGSGSLRVIRYWLSLFSLYRVIKTDFKTKLNTITDPFSGDLPSLDAFNQWISSFQTSLLITKFLKMELKDLVPKRVLPLQAAGSLGPLSFSSVIDSVILLKDKGILPEVLKYLKTIDAKFMLSFIDNCVWVDKEFPTRIPRPKYNYLGRLAFKEEAAGKLRIFAMVDVVTQSIFEPLHSTLLNLFKRIPNDSTLDQDRAFKYAQSLASKYESSYGFDLSSATDRLPISSQAALLNQIFGSDLGTTWAKILVSREYLIPENKYNLPENSTVKYAVGQPMGALSSWDMLNLTHHMMVQYCASLAMKTPYGVWYKDYVVLGDDIVIFDKSVADLYLYLCKGLGVEINLSKSVISPSKPVFEFAKRTSFFGHDVSAISFKDILQSNNFFGRLSTTSRLISRNYGKDLKLLFRLGNRVPSAKYPDLRYPIIGYLAQLIQKGDPRFKLSQLLSLITDSNYPLSFFGRKIHWLKPDILIKVLDHVIFGNKKIEAFLSKRELRWTAINSIRYKLILLLRILDLYKRLRDLNFGQVSLILRERCINIPEEIMFYKQLNCSLELEKRLDKRSYFKRFPYVKNVEYLNRIFLAFMPDKYYMHSDVNFRMLRLGLDVDLSRPRLISSFYWIESNLNKFDLDIAKYAKTKHFSLTTVEELTVILDDLISLNSAVDFVELSIKSKLNKKESIIENPLKMLDFIKDWNKPSVAKFLKSTNVDFLHLDGLVIDSDFARDMDFNPGFKPNLDFLRPKK